MKEAFVYIKSELEESIQDIKGNLTKFCIQNGYDIAGIFIERSQTKKEFNRLLCEIREKDVKYVVIERIDNLNSVPLDLSEMIKALAETGIKGIIQAIDGEVLDGYFLDKKFNNEMMSIFDEAEIFNPLYKIKGVRVAVYHLSLDPVRSGCIELQMKILRSFAERKSWNIVKEYIELTNLKSKKESEQKLIEEADQFDIVLVKNAYYFSRETSSFLALRNKLLKKGVRIYSLNEGWC